jgi:ABC-2 type transport system ATP-binding protein
MAIITVKSLTKKFPSQKNRKISDRLLGRNKTYKFAVDSISFEINKGESVAFLGPNGAGKTTTTKMLTGLIKPTNGSIKVLGYTPFDKKNDFLKKIGLVMGNKAGLNWDLSARQSFELQQKIYDLPSLKFTETLSKLTELLKVDHILDQQVRKLSLGERMKLELIGAILHNPPILFLDEPTIGLDISAKKNIRKFLKELHRQGQTIILTSHDMDDIASVCQRAIIINQGKLIFDDTMDFLKSKYSDQRYLKLSFTNSNPKHEEVMKYGEVVKLKNNQLVMNVSKDKVMEVASLISKKHPVNDIVIEQVALEEIISDIFENN